MYLDLVQGTIESTTHIGSDLLRLSSSSLVSYPPTLVALLTLESETPPNNLIVAKWEHVPRHTLPPGIVTFGPGSTCTLDTCPIQWSVYKYQPSIPANATFIGLFALGGLVHAYLGIRWKTWWFMCCMVICAINACIGYGGRLWLHYEPFNFGPFMMQMSESMVPRLLPSST